MMSQKKHKVLIVDHDGTQHRGLVVALESFELEVHAAVNPFRAIHLLKEIAFDIILTEFHFPTMDSRSIIDRFRKIAPEAALIVMSVYSKDEIWTAIPDTASLHFIQKPINVDVLHQKIKTLMNAQKD